MRDYITDLTGKYARLFAFAVGFLIFVLSLTASSIVLHENYSLQILEEEAGRIGQATSVLENVRSVLSTLNSEHTTECNEENLNQLRALLLSHRYISQIGLYDQNGNLYCTTAVGRLTEPKADPPFPILTPKGGQVWPRSSLTLSDIKVSTTVIRAKKFSVFVDSFIDKEVLLSSSGLLWVKEQSALRPMNRPFTMSDEKLQELRVLASSLPPGTHVDLPSTATTIISYIPEEDPVLILQRHFTLSQLIQAYKPAFATFLATSILLACLVSHICRPFFERYGTLSYRIRKLCTHEHIICLFQPIVNLSNGRIVGCEVLMRLRDGDDIYFPDEVLPMIVKNGLTKKLDQVVTSCALREIGRYADRIGNLKVSLNYFPESIKFEELHPYLRDTVEKTGTENLDLNLEVTEYSWNDDLVDQVRLFVSAGYLISVDDFGTGYSNLSSVRKLAPSFLKIDKSFVFDLEETSVRSSLIPEIMSIAHTVGADVIAEGIEQKDQVKHLTKLGCRFGQGYLFAKPLNIEEFFKLYQRSWISPLV